MLDKSIGKLYLNSGQPERAQYMAEEPKVPEKSGETPKTDPPKEVKTPVVKKEEFTIPDKFKDKSAVEIAKAYVEAEKKMTDMATKVSKVEEMEKTLAQFQQLGQIIEGNPAVYKAVEEEVKRKSGKTDEKVPQDETKMAMQEMIINGFENSYGLNTLQPEKRQALHRKIGQELAEMFDPSGTKPYNQVIAEIPSTKLRKYLDKAYRLSTIDDAEERGRLEGILQARQNSEASLGSMPASSGKSSGPDLTPEERITAKKMGIAEKDYAAYKQKIAEGK